MLMKFTQAFKVTGFPILAKAAQRMKARYIGNLRGLDKESANPLPLLLASIDPDSLSLLFQGVYSGVLPEINSSPNPRLKRLQIPVRAAGRPDEQSFFAGDPRPQRNRIGP